MSKAIKPIMELVQVGAEVTGLAIKHGVATWENENRRYLTAIVFLLLVLATIITAIYLKNR